MYIPVPESTIKRPLLFFQGFFNSDEIITRTKCLFYPDPEDEHDYRNKYPLTIDQENEIYTIEIPANERIYNDIGDLIDEIQSWEIITYKFEEELNKELKKQYFKSKEFLDEIINSVGTIEEVEV